MTDSRLSQILIASLNCLLIAAAWKLIAHPVVAIAIGLLPILISLTLRQPFLIVLAFVIFSFFRIHEVFPQLYSLRLPQLLAVASIGSLAFNILTKRIELYWRQELSVFVVFFALVTIGVFLSTNRAEAMSSWSGTYVKILIMVLAISWLAQTTNAFKLSIFAIIMAGILVGLIAISNKMSGIGLVEGTRVTIGRNIGSVLGDPNDLALVLLFPASFALGLVFTKKIGWLPKIFGMIGFAIVLGAIIATQSRGGLLGILAVMGVYGYRRIQNKALFLTLGVLALAVLLVAAGVSERASGGAHEAGIDESAMGRIHAWNAAINMALTHPLSGVGINNFLSNYFMYSDFWDGRNHAVHSTWFGVLAETGFLGFLIFCSMVFVLLRSAIRSVALLDFETMEIAQYNPVASCMAQSVLAGLVGFCTSGTFLTMGFTWPVYILLAFISAVSHYASKHSTKCLSN